MRLAALLPPVLIIGSLALATPTTLSRGGKRVASAWFPGWLGESSLDQVPWHLYTHLKFAFALTTSDDAMISLGSSGDLLTQFVTRAKKANVAASVAIGGWTGSQFFSKHVHPEKQNAFVHRIVDLVNKYDLDGIDFDWEYPNKAGIGCNFFSSDDSKNFLSFLKTLRRHPIGSKLLLTAAVSITPFAGENGLPLTDVSEFAKVLDYIAIMNYDVWGPWSTAVGPNAPLYDHCASPPRKMGIGFGWIGRGGMDECKVPCQPGVPAYGHSYYVDPDAAIKDGQLVPYPPFNSTIPPGEGETASTKGTDPCGQPTGPTGVWKFEGLISAGFLRDESGVVTPARGMKHRFDVCSRTPFVYNPKTHVMVSYDDALSFAAKGNFIYEKKLLGFAMWDTSGDSKQNTLVKAIRTAIFKA